MFFVRSSTNLAPRTMTVTVDDYLPPHVVLKGAWNRMNASFTKHPIDLVPSLDCRYSVEMQIASFGHRIGSGRGRGCFRWMDGWMVFDVIYKEVGVA